jgi:DNA-binding CsgD family transcriptional regulator
MERLSATDLAAVLEIARELGAIQEVDGLRASVLPRLRRLVRYDTASFNEIATHSREAVVAAVEPTDALFEGAEEICGAYAHQNPLIQAAQRPGEVGVRKFSDFISLRQLHRLEIYDLVYAPIEVEHQIAFTLPAPSTCVIGFALNRRRDDFSERDRHVLEAVRPFVTQAYQNAAAIARTRAAVLALHSRSDSDAGVVVLGPSGRVEVATHQAAGWLREIARREVLVRLPEPLQSWSDRQRLRSRDGLPRGEPLRVRANGTRLTAQFVAGGAWGLDAILLRRSQAASPTLAEHEPHELSAKPGLSTRESQVLGLLAQGLTNAQIAGELALSERTVAKHLERVYRKLGVHNRTAAALRARDVSMMSPQID